MLTLYSVVKGFDDRHTAIIQRNAIMSWQVILPDAEIILFGDDEPGARNEADRFGLPILPFERNEHGAPLIADVISTANLVAEHDIRCLVNADIILEPSFSDAAQAVEKQFEQFLFIMQRMNIGIEKPLKFTGNWIAGIKALSQNKANTSAIDVFCYRGDWLRDMPPFGMGRTSWDNWIVMKAAKEGIPIIVGSEFTKVWHQNHKKPVRQLQIVENRKLLKKRSGSWRGSLADADWKLTKDGTLIPRKRA